MGNKLLHLLIIEYMIIMIAFMFQKDYARGLYFLGATIISFAVLWMK